MARSMRYSTSRPSSLHVGTSFHDMLPATLVLYSMRSLSKTQSARTWPARHTSRFSDGLLTFEAVWLPTSWVAPVPPILKGGVAAFAAATKSLTLACGCEALFHNTNWSSAMTEIGVSSRQLN